MKILAEANGWQVILDENAVVSIHHGGAGYYNHESAYGAIVAEVKDPETRSELLKQLWGNKS